MKIGMGNSRVYVHEPYRRLMEARMSVKIFPTQEETKGTKEISLALGEVAAQLGQSWPSTHKLIRAGLLQTMFLGHQERILKDSLEQFKHNAAVHWQIGC